MSERWPATVSVGLLLENGSDHDFRIYGSGIILVTKRDTGLLGLIAGGVTKETAKQAMAREMFEETGLKENEVNLQQMPSLTTIIPGEKKSSVGMLFEAKTKKEMVEAGFEPNSEEISWVKPYTIDEIIELLGKPECLYRPDFNLNFLGYAVLRYIHNKYAFDGHKFQLMVARNWGVPEKVLQNDW